MCASRELLGPHYAEGRDRDCSDFIASGTEGKIGDLIKDLPC